MIQSEVTGKGQFRVHLQFSIVSIMLLTAAIAFQFRSPVLLNVGISITSIVLVFALPTTYSLWIQRQQLRRRGEYGILRGYLIASLCGLLNALLIAAFTFWDGLPPEWEL